MKKLLSLVLAVTMLSTLALAQEKISQGKVVYSIEWDSPEMTSDVKAMLPTESVLYFKNKMSRMEMSMGMMGDNITISNSEKDEAISYMNMMGNKLGIKMTKAERDATQKEYKPKVTKTNETKTIAGYKCTKYVVELKDAKYDFWSTKDIEADNGSSSNYEGIEGFLMEFATNQSGMVMKMTCKSVEKQSIADDMFNQLEGYEVMTQEEAKKKFQQMGTGQ